MIAIRAYQKATHDDLLKMLKWCQNNFNLRDWSISLETGEKPNWVDIDVDTIDGISVVDTNYMFAKIWIPIEKTKVDDRNPFQILAHEVLHVLTIGAGNINGQRSEFISYRLDDIVYRLYMGTINKDIMDIKDD
jgi:hypothetical protein